MLYHVFELHLNFVFFMVVPPYPDIIVYDEVSECIVVGGE